MPAVCPCDVFVHPRATDNPPGQATLAYRVGDYESFRHALLLALPGEQALLRWHPAPGDLGLQLLEWWAYLADILTFYSERIATESYLRTAVLPESTRRLVRLLGYRPRPGIGATATLAALLTPSGGTPPATIALPAGFAVQSKPGPGQKPQIFELDTQTTVAPPDAVAADPPPDDGLKGRASVLLAGTVTSAKPGDRLLVLHRAFSAGIASYAIIKVQSVTPEKAPRGKANTRLAFGIEVDALPTGAVTGDYQLLRSTQATHPWLILHGAPALTATAAHLDGVTRSIHAGDPVVFESSALEVSGKLQKQASFQLATAQSWRAHGIQGTFTAQDHVGNHPAAALARVTSYAETIWYANGSATDPGKPPAGTPPPIPIPILHSVLGFASDPSVAAMAPELTTVRYGWQEVAALLPAPAATMTQATTQLGAVAAGRFPVRNGQAVLVEDAAGQGVPATLSSSDGVTAHLVYTDGLTFTLRAPLRVLFGLLPMSRGETVPVEVLGSGEPGQAAQEFVLSKSPLTYLPDGAPDSPGYRSTLRVWVDGIEWKEVPSFYGQAKAAHVFATREDDAGKTYVRFGDGDNGARPPAGRGNITASYRRGSGAAAPGAGTLTSVQKPWPGLASVRNPVAAGGGSDPDPPAQLRKLAPRSVLTFGRAVSGDDWETIAAQAPGVTRARAMWRWDPAQQRTLVTVYVGDDQKAVDNARSALASYADPNRPKVVVLAQAVVVSLTLTIEVAPTYQVEPVRRAVRAALLDDDTGLFGATRSRIGEPVYESEIDGVCLRVPGAVAVHGLSFVAPGLVGAGPRFAPGDGAYFLLADASLTVNAEVSSG